MGDGQQRWQRLGRHPEPFGQFRALETRSLEVERELVRGREVGPITVEINPANVGNRRRDGSRSGYVFSAGVSAASSSWRLFTPSFVIARREGLEPSTEGL